MRAFTQIEDELAIRRGLLMQWMLQTDLSGAESDPASDELRKMRLEIEEIRLESELLSTMAGFAGSNRPPATDE